jgi:hypothetical protein
MKILTNLEHNKNQSKEIIIDNLNTFPVNPVNGQMFYNTNNDIMYYWNGIEWIPIINKRFFQFSVARNGNVSSDQDLRRQNGTPTSDSPYVLAFDSVLVAFAANTKNSGTNETWIAQLLVNNVVVYELNINNSKKAYENNININLNAGDEIRFRVKIGSSGRISKPAMTAWFKEL